MGSLINPVLFSNTFKIDQNILDKADLIDPILNCDTRLFIDPLLLSSSKNKHIKIAGYGLLKQRFQEIILLVDSSESTADIAWRTASKKLNLNECPETCLGYGGTGIGGSSRPETIKQTILSTTKEIINLGEKNPEIISLMGAFEEGVGADTISDLTTNAIMPALCQLTQDFCKNNKIPTKKMARHPNYSLPENPYRLGFPILLVPRDIVRNLPLAADWQDVSRVVMEIDAIRERFNQLIGDITKATLTDKKKALKEASLESLKNFRTLFQSLLNSSNNYDPNEDVFNFYAFRKIMGSNLATFKAKSFNNPNYTAAELKRVVDEIVRQFKQYIENNNMWELLWNDDVPKRERAAQLLFFAISDLFCKANNIDISPETNMGGGPVDFKFSTGYANRILVEIKLSKGTVEHGYTKQLEVYKNAANTDVSTFLIVDVGGMKNKLKKITKIRDDKIKNGDVASDIVVVNAKRRASASKI